jgi:hypothetical protein
MTLYIIFGAIIVLQSVLHFIERRDMANRLMSKSYTEYKQSADIHSPKKHTPSAHSIVLNRWRNKKGGDE